MWKDETIGYYLLKKFKPKLGETYKIHNYSKKSNLTVKKAMTKWSWGQKINRGGEQGCDLMGQVQFNEEKRRASRRRDLCDSWAHNKCSNTAADWDSIDLRSAGILSIIPAKSYLKKRAKRKSRQTSRPTTTRLSQPPYWPTLQGSVFITWELYH